MNLQQVIKVAFKRFKTAFLTPSVTVEYPAVYKQPPHGSRVAIRNLFSECIGCHDCEAKCPMDCIKMNTEDFSKLDKVPKTAKGIIFEKKVTSFIIDYNECTNCGICVEVCPTQALSFDKNFIQPKQKQKQLILDLVHKPRSLRKDED
ncbi:MAG: 4Fe-4S dicluster domain-containing protein [Oligoflexia bacterium]|nr:4Fe-4S dicluster domain-containing protein [Oligoflexia bacterium]